MRPDELAALCVLTRSINARDTVTLLHNEVPLLEILTYDHVRRVTRMEHPASPNFIEVYQQNLRVSSNPMQPVTFLHIPAMSLLASQYLTGLSSSPQYRGYLNICRTALDVSGAAVWHLFSHETDASASSALPYLAAHTQRAVPEIAQTVDRLYSILGGNP